MNGGLDDVIAADTVLSDVDGIGGHLTIRGYPLDTLAGRVPYEDVVHLLLDGFFPNFPSTAALSAALGDARVDVFRRVEFLLPSLATLPLYDGVRAGIALVPDGDTLTDALRLIAAPAVLTTALLRIGAGHTPLAPIATHKHANDILYMLGVGDDIDAKATALDTYLVAVCDHGLNASTFAARVVASTRAGLTSAVLAGSSALKGPLHGGAPGPVIAMLDAIATHGDASRWLTEEIASGRRLMGFGHRIYRVRDPRADALKGAIRQLSATSDNQRLAFAEHVEREALAVLRAAKPDRVLETNVEFYTALLLEAIGFPADAFTNVFAMGRVVGWLAHAREQQTTGRLIRPQSRYIGPASHV